MVWLGSVYLFEQISQMVALFGETVEALTDTVSWKEGMHTVMTRNHVCLRGSPRQLLFRGWLYQREDGGSL